MVEQEIFVVIGGKLSDPGEVEFQNVRDLHFVGSYPNRAEATLAWRGAAQKTVDDAHMRYFVVPLHEYLA